MHSNSIYVLGVILALGALAQAGPIVVDGDLSDWGVTVADNNASNMNAYAGMAGIGLLGWDAEDQNDDAGHGAYLGPNSGGQDYDAEMMLAAVNGGRLYIGIATGQRPDNGAANYSPGDIRIETSIGTFGIEVGGGAGGGLGSALTEGAAGSTYNLNSNGYTISSFDSLNPAAGSVYSGSNWILDPIAPAGPVQIDPNAPGAFRGNADFVFTRDSSTSQHAVIELSLDAAAIFGSGTEIQSIHWRPSCGNDEVDLSVSLTATPEPGTFVLLGGMLAAFALRRRRRREG